MQRRAKSAHWSRRFPEDRAVTRREGRELERHDGNRLEHPSALNLFTCTAEPLGLLPLSFLSSSVSLFLNLPPRIESAKPNRRRSDLETE